MCLPPAGKPQTELSVENQHSGTGRSGFTLRFLLSETETWLKYRRAIIPGGSRHIWSRQSTGDKISFRCYHGPFGLKLKRGPKKTNDESGVSVSRSVTVPDCWAWTMQKRSGYFGIFSNVQVQAFGRWTEGFAVRRYECWIKCTNIKRKCKKMNLPLGNGTCGCVS